MINQFNQNVKDNLTQIGSQFSHNVNSIQFHIPLPFANQSESTKQDKSQQNSQVQPTKNSSPNWSQQLKSNNISINDQTATQTKKSQHWQFCLSDIALTHNEKNKCKWTFKIIKKVCVIQLGICLKSAAQLSNFNNKKMNWRQTGHGFYMIVSDGRCYSHSSEHYNCVQKYFKFKQGDEVEILYDPIEFCLNYRLKQHKSVIKVPIVLPPQNDTYHPCIGLANQGDSVQLI